MFLYICDTWWIVLATLNITLWRLERWCQTPTRTSHDQKGQIRLQLYGSFIDLGEGNIYKMQVKCNMRKCMCDDGRPFTWKFFFFFFSSVIWKWFVLQTVVLRNSRADFLLPCVVRGALVTLLNVCSIFINPWIQRSYFSSKMWSHGRITRKIIPVHSQTSFKAIKSKSLEFTLTHYFLFFIPECFWNIARVENSFVLFFFFHLLHQIFKNDPKMPGWSSQQEVRAKVASLDSGTGMNWPID